MDGPGRDRTEAYVRGAREAVRIARVCGAESALLKSRSPSCDAATGVAAAALAEAGLEIYEID